MHNAAPSHITPMFIIVLREPIFDVIILQRDIIKPAILPYTQNIPSRTTVLANLLSFGTDTQALNPSFQRCI